MWENPRAGINATSRLIDSRSCVVEPLPPAGGGRPVGGRPRTDSAGSSESLNLRAELGQLQFDANVDTRVHKPQALLHRMSVIKNRMQVAATPDNWDGDEYAVRNARLCAAYQTVLAEANGLDFDDLLLATVRTLHEHPDARRAAGDRFPRGLVDEFQDTNLPQYVLVRQLAEGHNDVFVVGDPDQAIYGWRGAELTNIMSFQRDFPAARRIDLQLAYRSSARLLEAATAMIRHNADRLDHRLRSVNLPGLPPAVHDAADPTAEASFAVSRAAARIVRDLLIPAAQIYRIMLGNDADAWPSVLKPPTSDDRLVPKGIP